MSGIDAMVAIRSEFPEARIIVLTTFEVSRDAARPPGGRRGVHVEDHASAEPDRGDRDVHRGETHSARSDPNSRSTGRRRLTAREAKCYANRGRQPTRTSRIALHLGRDRQAHVNTSWRSSEPRPTQAVAIGIGADHPALRRLSGHPSFRRLPPEYHYRGFALPRICLGCLPPPCSGYSYVRGRRPGPPTAPARAVSAGRASIRT